MLKLSKKRGDSMSFVSVIAKEDFITVVSDGQVTRNSEAIQNNYKKFTKISNKQFIAYTGIKEFCEGLVSEIKYKGNEIHNLNKIALDLDKKIKVIPYETYTVMFIVGGIGKSGNIEFYTLNNNYSENLRYFNPKNDSLNYGFLHNGSLSSKINLENKLVEHLRITGFNTPNKCIKAQKLLNKDIAQIDPTVNNVTFDLTIKKINQYSK